MLHMLKNHQVIIMVTSEVLVLSLSQEHLQSSVYVGDPSSTPVETADVCSKILSRSIEVSFQHATEVISFPTTGTLRWVYTVRFWVVPDERSPNVAITLVMAQNWWSYVALWGRFRDSQTIRNVEDGLTVWLLPWPMSTEQPIGVPHVMTHWSTLCKTTFLTIIAAHMDYALWRRFIDLGRSP